MRARLRAAWNALAFAAGGAAVLAAAYAASEAVDPVFPTMQARVAHFRGRAAEVRGVTVGPSHSRAVDFGALGVPGAHLWRGNEDVFEAAYLGRYAAEHAPRLRYVLLPASYGLLRLDNTLRRDPHAAGARREMYTRAPGGPVLPGDRELWISARLAPVVRADHWSGVVLHLRDPRPARPLAPNGGPPRDRDGGPLAPDSMERHGRGRIAVHRAQTEETLAADPATPARARAALRTLARDLHARGVVLVLYSPPYHRAYLRHLDGDAAARRRAALGPLLDEPNVVWVEPGGGVASAGDDSLFLNSDHANAAGAREFSARLRPCLAALEAGGAAALPASCGRVHPGGGAAPGPHVR